MVTLHLRDLTTAQQVMQVLDDAVVFLLLNLLLRQVLFEAGGSVSLGLTSHVMCCLSSYVLPV